MRGRRRGRRGARADRGRGRARRARPGDGHARRRDQDRRRRAGRGGGRRRRDRPRREPGPGAAGEGARLAGGAGAGTSSGSSSATRCARSRRGSRAGSRSTAPRSAPRSPAGRPGARVLVEVNVGEEPQKGGCAPGDGRRALVDALRGRGLDVDGLMTVPPHAGDPRRWFAALRELARAARASRELSMGMSDDFEVAIEEGATMVRVGRALFGARALSRVTRTCPSGRGSAASPRLTALRGGRRTWLRCGVGRWSTWVSRTTTSSTTAASTSPTATTATGRRAAEPARRPRAGARPAPTAAVRDSGTVRTRPDTRSDYGTEYGAPASPAPAPTRARRPSRDEPSGMSAPRPSVVRTIGPTTAARVHVVEPQGFNDAQEVGDRLKANQPVILNLQGLPPRAAAAPDRLLERARLRGRRHRCSGSPTRSSCSRRATSRSPRRRRSGCRPAACSTPDPCAPSSSCASSPSTSSSSPAAPCSRGSRCAAARSSASLNPLLFDLTEPVLRPVRRVIPPAGMFDISFIVVFFVPDPPAVGASQ